MTSFDILVVLLVFGIPAIGYVLLFSGRVDMPSNHTAGMMDNPIERQLEVSRTMRAIENELMSTPRDSYPHIRSFIEIRRNENGR